MTDNEARIDAGLAIALVLEASVGEDEDSGWGAASRDVLNQLAAASGGSPATVRAAADLLDPVLDADAQQLLKRAEFYAAFWGD